MTKYNTSKVKLYNSQIFFTYFKEYYKLIYLIAVDLSKQEKIRR